MVENIMRQKRLKIGILRYIITMHQGTLGAQRTVMTDGDTDGQRASRLECLGVPYYLPENSYFLLRLIYSKTLNF